MSAPNDVTETDLTNNEFVAAIFMNMCFSKISVVDHHPDHRPHPGGAAPPLRLLRLLLQEAYAPVRPLRRKGHRRGQEEGQQVRIQYSSLCGLKERGVWVAHEQSCPYSTRLCTRHFLFSSVYLAQQPLRQTATNWDGAKHGMAFTQLNI